MRTPSIITTPFPTAEETAQVLGVPPARTRWLIRLAEQIVERRKQAASAASGKKRNAAVRKRNK